MDSPVIVSCWAAFKNAARCVTSINWTGQGRNLLPGKSELFCRGCVEMEGKVALAPPDLLPNPNKPNHRITHVKLPTHCGDSLWPREELKKTLGDFFFYVKCSYCLSRIINFLCFLTTQEVITADGSIYLIWHRCDTRRLSTTLLFIQGCDLWSQTRDVFRQTC